MRPATGFPPLAGDAAHTLILGSMPGQASLQAVRYYAHPRNAFWPIMLAIIDRQAAVWLPSLDDALYQQHCSRLVGAGFALWDVLASCERPGSLDSRIVRHSEQANDIAGLVAAQPRLQRIACNGRAAGKLLRRHCQASLEQLQADQNRELQLIELPSSSPAMASLTLAQKHQRWAEGLLG